MGGPDGTLDVMLEEQSGEIQGREEKTSFKSWIREKFPGDHGEQFQILQKTQVKQTKEQSLDFTRI